MLNASWKPKSVVSIRSATSRAPQSNIFPANRDVTKYSCRENQSKLSRYCSLFSNKLRALSFSICFCYKIQEKIHYLQNIMHDALEALSNILELCYPIYLYFGNSLNLTTVTKQQTYPITCAEHSQFNYTPTAQFSSCHLITDHKF